MAMMASIGLVSALKHDLKISADSRKSFTIESFGFVAGGTIDLTISRFSLSYLPTTANTPRAAFIVRKATSESDAAAIVERAKEENTCLMDESSFLMIDLSNKASWNTPFHISQKIPEKDGAGLYTFIFARCNAKGE